MVHAIKSKKGGERNFNIAPLLAVMCVHIGVEKPSFLRSFSRDERSQAKPQTSLSNKNKPQAPSWTPSTQLISPTWLKNVRQTGEQFPPPPN